MNLSGTYVLREIWQNNVANGRGMLCSVLKEIWRKPTQQFEISVLTIWKRLLHQSEKNKHFIICNILLPCKRKTIRCVSDVNELYLLLAIVWPVVWFTIALVIAQLTSTTSFQSVQMFSFCTKLYISMLSQVWQDTNKLWKLIMRGYRKYPYSPKEGIRISWEWGKKCMKLNLIGVSKGVRLEGWASWVGRGGYSMCLFSGTTWTQFVTDVTLSNFLQPASISWCIVWHITAISITENEWDSLPYVKLCVTYQIASHLMEQPSGQWVYHCHPQHQISEEQDLERQPSDMARIHLHIHFVYNQ